MLDNWVDPINDQVAWDFGYVNFEGFKKALREGNETAWLEFDIITSKIAREYGKDVEKEGFIDMCWYCKEEINRD